LDSATESVRQVPGWVRPQNRVEPWPVTNDLRVAQAVCRKNSIWLWVRRANSVRISKLLGDSDPRALPGVRDGQAEYRIAGLSFNRGLHEQIHVETTGRAHDLGKYFVLIAEPITADEGKRLLLDLSKELNVSSGTLVASTWVDFMNSSGPLWDYFGLEPARDPERLPGLSKKGVTCGDKKNALRRRVPIWERPEDVNCIVLQ
jgi:hypothetical protein